MIIDKSSENTEPMEEAPPSYDDVRAGSSSAAAQTFRDTKSPSSYSFASSSSTTLPSPSPKSPGSSSFTSKSKGKAPASSWWGFGTSQTTREVRTTVLGLVRDLVKGKSGNAVAAQNILESCAEACEGYSLSLSSLLQEKSIENHTPLYWAIINRPPDKSDEGSTGPSDLLTSLLSYSAPLTSDILTDVRQACLITDDQLLFQRLRLSPEFASLSGTDEMLLGESMIPDDISVENLQGDEGAFAVNFKIAHFQKRMRVSNGVVLEFIARGRMWRLALCVADRRMGRHGGPSPGSWCIALSLVENSPPTWIDSRLLIPDVSALPDPSPSSLFSDFMIDRPKSKPTITVRLRSDTELISPDTRRSGHYRQREIVVPLDSVSLGPSLQHAGSSYVGVDESLMGRLEARLIKPEAECIIC